MRDEAHCAYGGDDDPSRAEHTKQASGLHLGSDSSELIWTVRHRDSDGPGSHSADGDVARRAGGLHAVACDAPAGGHAPR